VAQDRVLVARKPDGLRNTSTFLLILENFMKIKALNIVSTVAALATMSVLQTGSAQTTQNPPVADKIKLGQVSLSFYAVTGGIVQEVLERSGVAFELSEGTHDTIYPKLGTGEIDILAASWLPNAHAGLYSKVKDQTFILSRLYRNAKLYLAVPDYAPKNVLSVADLAKPEISSQFEKTIVGIGASSGLMIGAEKMMTSYELRSAGYSLVSGPPANWIANFTTAYAEKRNVVMPLWQPQWLNASYKVRVLSDPQKIYGDGDEAVLLANNSLSKKIPDQVLKRLEKITLSVEAVTEMDRLVNVEKLSPRQAAQKWIAANPNSTTGWFPQ
jgi:glycine betaine/proline transport system substrate-binding protein